MRILIDTNIFIYREEDHVVSEDLSNLLRLLNELKTELFVHPLSIQELQKDDDEKRRAVNLSKIRVYSVLQRPPSPSHDFEYIEAVGPIKTSNDAIDNAILYGVYKNSVDFFITEDRGIHKKAQGLGIADRVFVINEAISFFNEFLPSKHAVLTPPALTEDYVHNLDVNDPLFDTLRRDYPEFSEWFAKISKEGRKCFVNRRSDGTLGAILIYKIENEAISSIPPLPKKKRLKIATMKVTHIGYKIGELLLKVSNDIALQNGICEIYLTHFTEPEDRLVDLITEFGFFKAGVLTSRGIDEDIFLKELCIEGADVAALTPVEISRRYHPSFYDGEHVRKLIIPIRPDFHDRLYADFSDGRQTRLYEHDGEFSPEGNTIKKAYLTHSRIKKVNPGDIVLFYRSADKKAIVSLGVVDNFYPDVRDIDEIIRIIGKRSVYSHNEIERSYKPLAILLFRHHFHLRHGITLKELLDSGILSGAPQSITQIDDEKFAKIKRMGGINESFTFN
ncbi:hypothetical protein [Methanocalculus sp.]|uniref:hypothetical protein n=1 Tax=Methanocalculus sp. TaxID=2004547 RepID=UPI0026057996|nr:hypothetical protein [Methanocalculus sp.]MDG6251361.1 hypothetical protein [Methanocalculus sp.]